jgi:hypothetical protein
MPTVVCYQAVDPNWEGGKKYAPTPGTPTTVQMVPVKEETVEFLVEAPVGKSEGGGDGAPPPPTLGEPPPGAPPAIPTPAQRVD